MQILKNQSSVLPSIDEFFAKLVHVVVELLEKLHNMKVGGQKTKQTTILREVTARHLS